LGQLPGGVSALREALQDRRAHAGELAAKMKKSETFNQGYMLTELLAAAELDMQWHTLPERAAPGSRHV
jgi:Zn-dependent oligopeptidase